MIEGPFKNNKTSKYLTLFTAFQKATREYV